MLKPVLGLAATGIAALLLWKVFLLFVLPVVAIAFGVAFTILKIGLIALAIWFGIWLFKKACRTESPAS